MIKYLKKHTFFLMAALMVVSFVSGSNIYAAEADINDNTFMIGGDLPDDKPQTAYEQYQEMLNDSSFSTEECQDFYTKMFGSTGQNTKATTITMKVLAVPYYKQETNYYCGPATARQTVAFFNGSAESQDTIWSKVKADTENSTVGDKLKNYVNDKQSKNTYGLKYPSSASVLSEDIYDDLNRDVPVILWVKVTKGGNWLYTTSGGHFLNASGINTGGSLVEVTDPYIGWVSGSYSSGKYWVTSQEAYSATTARGLGYYK